MSIPACHAGDRGSIPRRGGSRPFLGAGRRRSCARASSSPCRRRPSAPPALQLGAGCHFLPGTPSSRSPVHPPPQASVPSSSPAALSPQTSARAPSGFGKGFPANGHGLGRWRGEDPVRADRGLAALRAGSGRRPERRRPRRRRRGASRQPGASVERLSRPDGVGGIVVSIAAFQAVDPGSIPGQRSESTF